MTEPKTIGTLYAIGLGPGDPDLLTIKASKLLGRLPHVFAPKADERATSIARGIARDHLGAHTVVHELVYPMTRDKATLLASWQAAAQPILALLLSGQDVGFVTLGDPSLYSTASYLLRALRRANSTVNVVLVPAVTSYSACAARTGFVLGEGDSTLTIAPAPDSEAEFDELLARGGKLVLMKIGARLPTLRSWLEARQLDTQSHLVERVGLEGETLGSPLSQLTRDNQAGYLSTLLVNTTKAQEQASDGSLLS
jgi:precorrin-2/cobalt-factor-2 C20-methyltransferase